MWSYSSQRRRILLDGKLRKSWIPLDSIRSIPIPYSTTDSSLRFHECVRSESGGICESTCSHDAERGGEEHSHLPEEHESQDRNASLSASQSQDSLSTVSLSQLTVIWWPNKTKFILPNTLKILLQISSPSANVNIKTMQ